MKLLVITQKIDADDDVLGFFHGWLAEFARRCEKVTAVCLSKGRRHLSENVKVLSLGKEKYPGHQSVIHKSARLFRFYRCIWQERRNYNAVFVHMNPEYVVLGGWFWKLWGKRVSLWYAHGHVPLTLKIAEKFCDVIFTSTKSGCRINSKKIKVVGQGIDTEKFKVQSSKFKVADRNSKFIIVSVGRISPSKDYETLINAAEILVKEGANISVRIIGGPAMPRDERYFENLKVVVENKRLESVIEFCGAAPNKEIPAYLQNADLFVNTGLTGSLDKAVLEAMAVGLPVLTCNEAFFETLGRWAGKLMFAKSDAAGLAQKISDIMRLSREEREGAGLKIRQIVERGHSLKKLITKIINPLESDFKMRPEV